MISNVSNSTPSTGDTTTSSSSSGSNISEVNGIFGLMFIQNLGGADPTLVGWDYGPNNIQLPPGMTMDDLNALTSSSASSTPASSTTSTDSPTSAASSAPAAESAAATNTVLSSNDIIPGVPGTDPNAVMTAQQVFGSSPWASNPTVTGPAGTYGLNPQYFATQQTAQLVAEMTGGSVVPVNNMANTPGNVNSQNMPNEMIKLSDGGMINAGLVAGFFTHGYSLSMVETMVQNEVKNVEAATEATQNQGVTQA